MNLLLIDDERRKAKALIAYLMEIEGWAVQLAIDPDEALSQLPAEQDRYPYDAILLDIMMPPGKAVSVVQSNRGRDTGLVLLELIWQRTMGEPPIVVHTARNDLEDRLAGDQRVAMYIQKPRLPAAIAEALRKLR